MNFFYTENTTTTHDIPGLTFKSVLFQYESGKRLPVQSQLLEQSVEHVHI